MPYPAIAPTARQFDPGDYPVRKYNAQNGAEVRILYGNKRFGLRLALSYTNITDPLAEKFLNHYDETTGTFSTFTFSPDARVALFAGWSGNEGALSPPSGVDWRYEKAPQVTAVRPGISTITVSLVGVI